MPPLSRHALSSSAGIRRARLTEPFLKLYSVDDRIEVSTNLRTNSIAFAERKPFFNSSAADHRVYNSEGECDGICVMAYLDH